ncbi:universal stress protein [Ramlibacter tataouinensis]|uniref:universal stress protein n=1 Tax=Ramlibacter tataouinensis TaxID=94132 RepID=UPI0022F3F773|nr:universal stress protein [Ramlibacter tataouinensis]WBY01347.1 universal stress protein [Ramlibacter tataouinensis]
MRGFDSVLLALDGSPEAARGASCALWLADALGATLHVVHATRHPLAAADELARLRVPHARGSQVVVHQLQGEAEPAILEEIEAHRIDLVVMTARGESASADAQPARALGSVVRAVIERTRAPVVLLPARYRERLPWTSMLAAASGEAAADQALDTATRLAAALRIRVTVVHSEDGPSGAAGAALGSAYADAPHHEYPRRLDQLVARGLARCSEQEAACVDDVLLCRGEPAAVLLEQAARLDSSVLALGWHGALGAGRAPVFKRLLETSQRALLLVRGSEASGARLKVGSEIDA